MRYEPLPASFFKGNRQALTAMLPEGGVAVLLGASVIQTSADSRLPFWQDPDFYYLTGIDQEDCALIVWPGAPTPDLEQQLFVPETNEHLALWEGEKLTKEQASARSGVATVQWRDQFDTALRRAALGADTIFLNANEQLRAQHGPNVHSLFAATVQEKYPLHRYGRLAPLLYQLRAVKSPEEIDALAVACIRIGKAWQAGLRSMRDGQMEYQLTAEVEYAFKQVGSRKFSFNPIVAGGANACVLHYEANDARLNTGDLVLFDIGTEYAGYASDMTRVAPVSGRFSDRQRAVTEAVLATQRYATGLLKPGITLADYSKEVGRFMADQLHQLGLLTAEQAKDGKSYRKYFPHGTSHHLGLDVHDVALMDEPLHAGNVLTVEPGIYIREEGIGVRLENDVVLLEGRNRDLMDGVPIAPDEVEAIMNDK